VVHGLNAAVNIAYCLEEESTGRVGRIDELDFRMGRVGRETGVRGNARIHPSKNGKLVTEVGHASGRDGEMDALGRRRRWRRPRRQQTL